MADTSQPAGVQAVEWLTWLYGGNPAGRISICAFKPKIRTYLVNGVTDAAARGMMLDAQGSLGVYFRLTTVRDDIFSSESKRPRGDAEDSAYLYALSMDLDIKGPGHEKLTLPETEEEVHLLVKEAGLPEPSAWVHSGGGLYPFWVLPVPLDLTEPGMFERAQGVQRALFAAVNERARTHGWEMDNTSDLARVYRLPGTANRKTGAERPCVVLERNDHRYTLQQLRGALPAPVAPAPVTPAPAASTPEPIDHLFASPSELAAARNAAPPAGQEEVRRRVEQLRDRLAVTPAGSGNAEANNVGFLAGQYVGAGQIGQEEAEGILLTAFDSWTFRPDAPRQAQEASLRSGIGKGIDNPRAWAAAGTVAGVAAGVNQPASPQVTGRLRKAMLARSAVRTLPDPVPLIEDVLYRESVVVLSGKFGTYKSFIAVGWAGALATGRPWFGHGVPAPVPVIYAAAEGAYGIRKRLDAWEAAPEHGPIPDSMYLIPISVRINRPDDIAELEELIAEVGALHGGAPVLIFDTLHTSTPGADENDAGEMGAVLDVLRGLQERHRITSILVHHTGHGGERSRGSSSIEDDADTSFVIRLDGEDRGPEALRTLVHRKTKDARLLEPVPLELNLVERAGSGYVAPLDPFAEKMGPAIPDDVGQVDTIREPGDWVLKVTKLEAVTQHRILQTLADIAGETGRTESQVRTLVASRWHEGKVGRGKGYLNPQVFQKAWIKVLEIEVNGERLAPNVGGQRYAVNPVLVSLMP